MTDSHALEPSQFGFTLIETIVFLVVISLAGVTAMKVINHTNRQSTDPIMRFTALGKAQGVLEEIQAHAFYKVPEFDKYHDASDPNYLIRVRVIAAGEHLTLRNEIAWLITVSVETPSLAPLSLSAYRVQY